MPAPVHGENGAVRDLAAIRYLVAVIIGAD
jgi:hypothetical protein